jgi:hypothetical protein
MPWPTFGTWIDIPEHRLYISNVRHTAGYRRTWQANHSGGRFFNGVNMVSIFLLYEVHILMDAFVALLQPFVPVQVFHQASVTAGF